MPAEETGPYLTNEDWSRAMVGHLGDRKVAKSARRIGPFHQWTKEINERGLSRMVDRCRVDIIIPYYCNYDLVRRALLSVLRHTWSNPYLVTLVDDGSPGRAAIEFAKTIGQAPQLQIVRLEKQQGFGAAVSAGLANTEQPYVCILHSDCEVKHLNWLGAMGEALVKHKGESIRFVSACSNNPNDEDVPELKLEYDEFNHAAIGKDITTVDSPLPMYCCMCHRGLFERIGPIKHYPYTYFENEEFFYRMKFFGYKQAVAAKSWVHHEGSATVNYILKQHPNPAEVQDQMQKNRDRCLTELRELHASKR